MATRSFELVSPDHTDALGRALAAMLGPGDVLLLDGELGAGKTTLVRSLAAARGVEPAEVSSPTFTVVHEHRPDAGPPIVHADAYRLEAEDPEELERLGLDRALAEGAIVLIEWGSRVADLLDRAFNVRPARLALAHAGETERAARLEVPDSWCDRAGWPGVEGLAGPPPGFPFASEREQWADLHNWLSEAYRVTRPLEEADLDEG